MPWRSLSRLRSEPRGGCPPSTLWRRAAAYGGDAKRVLSATSGHSAIALNAVIHRCDNET